MHPTGRSRTRPGDRRHSPSIDGKGDSLDPVVDAIRRTDGIEWIAVRNEEVGAFAAAAEAELTGGNIGTRR